MNAVTQNRPLPKISYLGLLKPAQHMDFLRSQIALCERAIAEEAGEKQLAWRKQRDALVERLDALERDAGMAGGVWS